jgi:uncharacterized protein (DUF1015 family)
MAIIKPFRGVRPPVDLASRVAALPYDVMDVAEAREMAAGEPFSFLHISRPEIDLPEDVDIHSEPVYRQGTANLENFLRQGVMVPDEAEYYYVYRQVMGGLVQTGLVACSAVDDYQSGVIRKHELTRQDKEDDRVRHIDSLDANDEPVFLTYRAVPAIDDLVAAASAAEPEYDFVASDGVRHTLWVIRDRTAIDSLSNHFAAVSPLYVADGHHRSAAASRVRDIRAAATVEHTGREEYNMPYNRVVRDLNGLSIAEFMARVAEKFEVTPLPKAVEPSESHCFGMFLGGKWYELSVREGVFDPADPVARLDVSILQNSLLNPVLGIRNPRTDQRIQFVGGIRGVAELERLVETGGHEVAFSLHPTSIRELMALADKIMPPKSTWFEPKLRSGLFLHLLK